MARIIEIEIGCCGECPYYSMKKHKCQRGAVDEGEPRDHFYRDCPLPWHEISENDMDGGDNIMNTNPECFTPEGNKPYPLCTGKDMPECENCQDDTIEPLETYNTIRSLLLDVRRYTDETTP